MFNILIIDDNKENNNKLITYLNKIFKNDKLYCDINIKYKQLNNLKNMFKSDHYELVEINYKYKIYLTNVNFIIIDLKCDIFPWKNKYKYLLYIIKVIFKNNYNCLLSGGALLCALFEISTNYFSVKFNVINPKPNIKNIIINSNNNYIIDYSNGNIINNKNKETLYNINFHLISEKIKYDNDNNRYNLISYNYNYAINYNTTFKNKLDYKLYFKNCNNLNFDICEDIDKYNFIINNSYIWAIHKITPINQNYIYDIIAESKNGIEMINFLTKNIVGFKFNITTNNNTLTLLKNYIEFIFNNKNVDINKNNITSNNIINILNHKENITLIKNIKKNGLKIIKNNNYIKTINKSYHIKKPITKKNINKSNEINKSFDIISNIKNNKKIIKIKYF